MFFNDHLPIPKLRDSNVDFCEITYLPGGSTGPRVQSGLQMVQIMKGSLTLYVDDQISELSEGQAILLTPGKREMFHFSPSEPTQHGWATWYFGPDGYELQDVVDALPECGRILNMDINYLNLFKVGLHMTKSTATPRQKNALFTALLEEHLKDRNREGLDPRVQKAINLIRGGELRELTPSTLAKGVHQSLPHLNRLFKEHLGTTPGQAIWDHRLESASRLLLETGLHVEEIGQRTGVSNPSHFCKRFRRRFGLTPLQYRKQHWAKP